MSDRISNNKSAINRFKERDRKGQVKHRQNNDVKTYYRLNTNTSEPTIIKPANIDRYIKPANEVYKILSLRRQDAMNNISELRTYRNTALNYCSELWKNNLESKQVDDSKHYVPVHMGVNIPTTKLTKSGKVPEQIIVSTLDELSGTFNVVDEIPFMLGNALIKNIVQAPKTIIAETHFNAIGKHDRPCYVIRKLLTCEVDYKTNLLVADEKYYQNSPTVAFPITLLVGAESNGACQLSRIDSIGHLGLSATKTLGLEDKVNIEIPDYLIEKFESSHHNAVPNNKKANSKFNIKKISATHHIHQRDDNFELLYALSHLSKTCIYKTEPSKFLRFNAKQLHDVEFYVDQLREENVRRNLDTYEHLKLLSAAQTLQQNDLIHNNGVISTALLQEHYAKTYNITNYECNSELCEFLDELRTFKPDRLIKLINTEETTPKRKYLTIPTPKNNTLAQDVKKWEGKIIDFDYAKEQHPDIVEKYFQEKAQNQNSSDNETTKNK